MLFRLLFLGACMFVSAANAADRVRLYVPQQEQDTQVQMARDIARRIARAADLDLDIRPVAGTPEALLRLHESGTLQLAMLQADAAQAYQGAMQRGMSVAERMLEPVRTIAPLHAEDIYFVVRSDAQLETLNDLVNARINLGPPRSDSALTGGLVYRILFGKAIPDHQVSTLPTDEALVKLITEQTLDAVAIVAARPAKLLANMKPGARNFVKLLKFDSGQPGAAGILGIYAPVTIGTADYPNLLTSDQTVLSVRTLLVAAGHGKKHNDLLARFARGWCKNAPMLIMQGHLQWSKIDFATSPLVPGWKPSSIVENELRACQAGATVAPESCPQEERLLGLCE